jgi:hypothetical protein
MLKKVKTEGAGISFKEAQKWSDFLVLSPAGKEYPCHRIILANKSSFFRMILSNENVENTDKKITLQVAYFLTFGIIKISSFMILTMFSRNSWNIFIQTNSVKPRT